MKRFIFLLGSLSCMFSLLSAAQTKGANGQGELPEYLPPKNEIADRSQRERNDFNLYYRNQRRFENPNFGAGIYYYYQGPNPEPYYYGQPQNPYSYQFGNPNSNNNSQQ